MASKDRELGGHPQHPALIGRGVHGFERVISRLKMTSRNCAIAVDDREPASSDRTSTSLLFSSRAMTAKPRR